ncbi:MAG: alpha-L-fucosidase [Acidobacteria bacterium]|nr:alpha-L-fucosidase [Acidobacteriota bacterium]
MRPTEALKRHCVAWVIPVFVVACLTAGGASGASKKDGPYQPTTESLRKHRVPEWFEDAKFGIFIHWGVYAVPAYHEWYVDFISPKASFGFLLGGPPYTATRGNLPQELFQAKVREEALQYHLEKWGPNFAYDDFIPMFKAEKFNPDAWAELFREAGAKYVVLTAKHGDEFALWPTQCTRRNSMEMGPRRDLVGDLTTAVRRIKLKMGFYHNTTYTFWDPRYPGRDWVEYMNNSIKELVDRYHPSILWGDVREGPVRDWDGKPLPADYWNSKEVLAYFYNHSEDPDDVVANDRWGRDTDGKFLGDFATPERTRMNQISKEKWEECDSLGPTSWGYNSRLKRGEYMTPNQVVDYLVDVVSKNGNLLINIGPRADGTIPEVMGECLRQVGQWLQVNGEAIYASRYWDTHQDGDVRFTRKGNTLYAIALEWPEDDLRLSSLAGKEVLRVEMLGLDEPVKWKQDADGQLVIGVPAKRPCRYAYTFKIVCRRL